LQQLIYEPELDKEVFFHSRVITNLEEFKKISDVNVANRLSDDISDVESKVVTGIFLEVIHRDFTRKYCGRKTSIILATIHKSLLKIKPFIK